MYPWSLIDDLCITKASHTMKNMVFPFAVLTWKPSQRAEQDGTAPIRMFTQLGSNALWRPFPCVWTFAVFFFFSRIVIPFKKKMHTPHFTGFPRQSSCLSAHFYFSFEPSILLKKNPLLFPNVPNGTLFPPSPSFLLTMASSLEARRVSSLGKL